MHFAFYAFSQSAAPSASVREAIYFGPAGPVRIRIHVSIDGRPADAVWSAAIDALFAFRDRNGDGSLDQAERSAFAPPARRGREVDIALEMAGVQPLRLAFNQKDEKLSKAAFAEAMRSAGQASVALRVVPARPDSRDLSAALFKHLDTNGDGRLSPDELRAARERLAFLDVDEDEFITAGELLSRSVAENRNRVVLPGRVPRQPEPVDSSPDLLFLTADGAQAVKQILSERGGRRATALNAKEFGADPKAFAALDKDGNGRLDTTELTAWLRQPPDLELALSFDATAAKLTVLSTGSHRTEPSGAVFAALPGGRFQFDPPDAGPPAKAWDEAASRLRDQFKDLAKDGSVERKQLEAQPGPLSLFELADRNADGKVSPADVEAALKAVAPLARCRVDVTFADQGNGLFELLDRNGDGRLSPRELVEAVELLKPFAGPDGAVGPNDLVRRFQVRAALEPIPIGVLVPPARRPPADEPARPAAPAWFTKMDRNGDGDVSLREFLGPVELFRKLDRDGDGLISPAEANAGTR